MKNVVIKKIQHRINKVVNSYDKDVKQIKKNYNYVKYMFPKYYKKIEINKQQSIKKALFNFDNDIRFLYGCLIKKYNKETVQKVFKLNNLLHIITII